MQAASESELTPIPSHCDSETLTGQQEEPRGPVLPGDKPKIQTLEQIFFFLVWRI